MSEEYKYKKFRELRADELECRIGNTFPNGFTLLLYKTSRADMQVLDETVGPENWKTEYKDINGDLYCTLFVRVNNEWIGKQDCGIESKQTDGNERKAAASDALKRCGFLWGIARSLYSTPLIYIKAEMETDAKGKFKPKNKIYPTVADIEYKDGKITYLVITNGQYGDAIYTYGKSSELDPVVAEKLAKAVRV